MESERIEIKKNVLKDIYDMAYKIMYPQVEYNNDIEKMKTDVIKINKHVAFEIRSIINSETDNYFEQ